MKGKGRDVEHFLDWLESVLPDLLFTYGYNSRSDASAYHIRRPLTVFPPKPLQVTGDPREYAILATIALSCTWSLVDYYDKYAMLEQKRKRDDSGASERVRKRPATEQSPADVVKVSLLPDEDEWAPVVGTIVCACILHEPTTLYHSITALGSLLITVT